MAAPLLHYRIIFLAEKLWRAILKDCEDQEAQEDELVGQDVISGTIHWWKSLSRVEQEKHLAWIHEQLNSLAPDIASLFQILYDRIAAYPEEARKPWYTLEDVRESGERFFAEEQEICHILSEGLRGCADGEYPCEN
jgi:hypothetical protein